MAHFNSPCGLCLCELPVILQDFPVLLLGSLSVIDYVLQIRGVVSLIKNSFVVSLMKKKQKKIHSWPAPYGSTSAKCPTFCISPLPLTARRYLI